jgi:U3 small nucleolar RNA-associated protein 20
LIKLYFQFKLNSWDTRRIEEPDYLLRLEAFAALNKIVDSWTVFDIRLASVLVYNCFFFLNNIDDLAIKESATNCIKAFLIKSAGLDLQRVDKALLESNFVSEIKNGLRNKNENARHEFVKVLVQFVKSFRQVFTKYEDLTRLMDSEDPERDFYENIIHIQVIWRFFYTPYRPGHGSLVKLF